MTPNRRGHMASYIARRKFLATLLGGVAGWPLTARAQQPGKLPIVGFLGATTPSAQSQWTAAFVQRLRELDWIEGRNVAIEYRWMEGRNERAAEIAAEFVRLRVNVIVVQGTAAVVRARQATSVIPIVFALAGDPVGSGLVESLARPGGNVTGVTALSVKVGPKQLELLHELIPTQTVMAALVNPTNPGAESQARDLQEAARTLGVHLQVLNASTDRDIEMAFTTLLEMRASGLVITPDAFFISRIKQVAALTARHSVPAIYGYREFAVAGGLMSYGAVLPI